MQIPRVNIGGLRFGALAGDERARILEAARAAVPTYEHVGSTLDPARWDGPAVKARHLDIGNGEAGFAAGREALRSWVPHVGIGASIEPTGQAVVVGATVLVVLRRGPVQVVAPNRIVAVVDEPRRFGFAYGSLPGHPERGEESFVVEHLPDDAVRATIRVQATSGTLAAQAAAPLVHRLQSAAIDGYLRAIAGHVRGGLSVTGLDHVVLNVADVERSLAFYCDRLGLAPVRVDEWRRGEVPFPSVRVDAGTIIDLLHAARHGENVDHLCLVVEPTDLEVLKAAGQFEVVDGPGPRFGARGEGTSLYVRDPDGNVVELRHYGLTNGPGADVPAGRR